MKLKNLQLKNVRSHKESGLDFHDGITVFTGRTGSGKSTILMAVEYALFGNEAGIPNESIMRRHSNLSSITLNFEHKNDNYELTRGLKKSGSKVLVDNDALCIKKNGSEIDFVKRANDMNEIIRKIMGFPENLKSKELFETIAYTKQDEIRALIELKPEERQIYIDNILQLSKYQNTWANVKTIISYFEKKVSGISGELVLLPKHKEELELFIKKINDSENELKINSSELEKANKEFELLEHDIKGKKEKFNKALLEKSFFDKQTAIVDSLQSELKSLKNELLKSKFKDFNKKELEKINKLDELVQEYANLLSSMQQTAKELRQTESEKNEILSKLSNGKSTCPLCRQSINSEHVKNLETQFNKKISELNEKIKESNEKIPGLTKETNEVKELKKEFEKNSQEAKLIDERKKTISEKENLLASSLKKLNELNKNADEFSKLKNELDALNERENGLIRKKSSLETSIHSIKENLVFLNDNERKKKLFIEALENESKKLEKTNNTLKILRNMREDIRNIRDVVRIRFLEDFRQLFQNKFEEIRKEDSEYAVSITKEYEPVAYTTTGIEVSISSLSGGEKTSVALAYRLAIADLAAMLGGIQDSKMLILDEPTVGFDYEDISALPAVLRNLKNIPQVIIVTHEIALKDTADYKYKVQKQGGISKIMQE